jgi:uncharacterized protein YkwD
VTVARLRLITSAMLGVLCLSAVALSAQALGTPPRSHARAHRASRCGRTARKHARKDRRARRRTRSRCLASHRSHTPKPASHHSSSPNKPKSHARKPTRSAAHDSGGECPNATLRPTDANLESIRAATLCLINRERTAHGESPLHANGALQQAAQGHTESMVQDDYFEHVGPDGVTPLQRARAAGYVYSSNLGCEVGENIGWGTLWQGTPAAIVSVWMNSQGHRENILDPHYTDTGIGVSPHPPAAFAGGQSGGIYTQDFGVLLGA